MVEPRMVPDLKRLSIGRPKIIVGSKGSAVVGGQIVICLVRLYGSPTVVVWSKGMYNGRAKTVMGVEDIGVGRCREIAYRYVMIGIGCSVDHYGLFLKANGFLR